jgi:ribosomal protein S18 acetylase RimI-like enzyme
MADTRLPPSLDHPILAALTTAHAHFAQGNGLALRYPRDVSPMAALREPTAQAFDDLRALVGADEGVALVTRDALAIPGDWEILLSRFIDQMVHTRAPLAAPGEAPPQLGDADIPDMLALTALTKPGPFAERTIRMGRYYGLRAPDGRLMAMAGERMTSSDFTEISAVCTHPEFAGRGLGSILVSHVLAQLLGEGRQPILHVKTENDGARRLYERLGFEVNGAMSFVVLKPR